MKNITINKIKSILQNINYPGFRRDIVSFGMVKNISIEGGAINISLQVNSKNEENLILLKNDIKEKLQLNGLDEVNIHFQKSTKPSEIYIRRG